MKPFPAQRPSEARALSGRESDLPAYYGLPQNVQFCRMCVLSNQRPASAIEYRHDRATRKVTVPIGADGICDACRIHKLKHGKIDWEKREAELWKVCEKYRRNDGRHDCIVPGSGGKDSGYAAHLLKYKFGMNPLTVTWAPHIYTTWGWENFQAWIHSGFDNFLFTPNGRVHRLLTRISVETLLHPFQPFIIGQKLFAPALAAKLDIPLVFWGEPEAEDGNPIAEFGSAEQDWRYFTSENRDQVMLSGVSIGDLGASFGLTMKDLTPYMPADPKVLQAAGVTVHYMGYYVRWHPQGNYYYATEHTGFKAAPERTAGTYGKYSGIDDKIDDFHYYTTYIKFGIGRTTYDAAQEARNQDVTREEAVGLVRRYDGEFPERFARECFGYMSIDEKDYPVASKMFEHPAMDAEYFAMLADHFRSPHLWKNVNGEWALRHAAWHPTHATSP
jgi:N-acetyl sugar amidotransferase